MLFNIYHIPKLSHRLGSHDFPRYRHLPSCYPELPQRSQRGSSILFPYVESIARPLRPYLNSLELILSNTLAHSTSTTNTTSNQFQHIINIVLPPILANTQSQSEKGQTYSTTPFLMRNNITPTLHLRFLNQFSVRSHSPLGIGAGELITNQCCRMETGKGDELPAIPKFGEALDVCFLIGGGHGCFPVEGGGEVV